MNRVDTAKVTGAYREWWRTPRSDMNAPRVGGRALAEFGPRSRTATEMMEEMTRALEHLRVTLERRLR